MIKNVLFILLIASIATLSSHAIEVTGKVIASDAQSATVELQSTNGIQTGDTVTYSTTVAGRVLEAARGEVLSVNADNIEASISNGRVNVGMDAKLEITRFVHPCDPLSAIPGDLLAVSPAVSDDLLETASAVKACREAIAEFPEEARFHAQLARAYQVAAQPGRAILSYKRAIKLNPDYPIALFNLANILYYGPEELRNDDLARAYFESAAKLDHYPAMSIIGTMMLKGIGGPQERDAAAHWFGIAADLDEPLAQNHLAECYENGWGVEEDISTALIWYRSSAEQKHPAALRNLGRIFYQGIGVKKNPERAINWFTEAAALGDAEAQYTLGRIYLEGIDALPDSAKALELFSSSAKNEYIPAIQMLAEIYYEGDIVKRDYDLAAAYYKQGAEIGDPSSQYSYGLLLEKGSGVDRDKTLAIAMFRRAARQEHIPSQERLTKLKEKW
ncbi:MAG: tetratricopeptide repeat protein [Verrucomicrobiota bacterium]